MSKKRATRNKKVFKATMQRRKFRRGSLNRFGPKRKNIQEPEVRPLASARPQGAGAAKKADKPKPTNVSRGPAETEEGLGMAPPTRVDTTPKPRPTPTPRKTTVVAEPEPEVKRPKKGAPKKKPRPKKIPSGGRGRDSAPTRVDDAVAAAEQTAATTNAQGTITPAQDPKDYVMPEYEKFTPKDVEVVKTGQGFDYRKMDAALAKLPSFKEGSTKATYDNSTGMYTLEAFGTVSEKTPEEMAELAGASMDDFIGEDQSLIMTEDQAEQLEEREGVTATEVTDPGAIARTEAVAQKAEAPDTVDANLMTAISAKAVDPTKAATGTVSTMAEATKATLSTPAEAVARDAAQELASLAEEQNFEISGGAYVDKVTGKTASVAPTKEAEEKQREAITGVPATDGKAAQIIGTVGYEAAQRRSVKGEAAKGAAASMVAEVGNLPPDITAAIVEDPATVEAQLDNQPVEVRAAVAALPTEALVSSQMETLLAGIDEGVTPAWARPALAAVEQKLAQRGLSSSTVGRDALFNSIIQSALPIAQSNAQALQTRAAQNLTNQQQANLQQSTQDMQRRMANLANRQTAASQTAQFAQQMSTLQSQFNQQAVMTSAQQQQQTRLQNLQNRQQAAVLNSQNQQAINAQNLGNEQQMELANLQIESETEGANQAARNQERLAEMQVAADFLSKNAGFRQQMELANLSNDQQMRLANLSAMNQASADNLNASQQTELANLNARLQTNLTAGKIAAEMNQAQLTVDQQRAVQNAAMVANVDLTKFNAAQQTELANSKFMQSMTMRDFDGRQQAAMQNATMLAQMDMQEADLKTRASIENAKNFLQMDMANLNNKQQALIVDQQMKQQRLLSDQAAENAARQFNASSQNQVDQFNTSMAAEMTRFNTAQLNSMEQFNATEANRLAAVESQNTLEVSKANAQLATQVDQFNETNEIRREEFNAANRQAIAQANVEWRRKSNLVDTAATNAANQMNAQAAFNLDLAEQDFIWQNLRDEANYVRSAYEKTEDRKVTMYAMALQNQAAADKGSSNTATLLDFVTNLYKGGD